MTAFVFVSGFVAGMIFLAVVACIFVENEEKNNRKW